MIVLIKKRWLLILGIIILLGSGILYFYLTEKWISYVSFMVGILGIVISLIQSDRNNAAKQEYDKIIEDYKRKYEEELNKSKKIEQEKQDLSFEKVELKKFLDKVNETLQRENISKEELIEKIDAPLKALILMKTSEDIANKRFILRDKALPELGFKYFDKGIYVLPPTKTPSISTKKEIADWIKNKFKKYVGKDYEYIIQIAVIVDFREIFCEKNVAKFRKKGKTILDIFGAEDIIPTNQVIKYLKDKKNLSSKDIIELPNIVFLVEDYLIKKTDLEKLRKNNDEIINKIKKTIKCDEIKTTDLANIEKNTLSTVLKDYVSDTDLIADRIKENATFWKSYFEHRLK